MSEGGEKNIYRTIVKATGLFGGTQVFTILCSIIKTKLVAVWLGAEGVGIIGLYNNTVEMISSLTRLGIGTSSVRDLSKAFKSLETIPTFGDMYFYRVRCCLLRLPRVNGL